MTTTPDQLREVARNLLHSLRYQSSRPGAGRRGLMPHHIEAFLEPVAQALAAEGERTRRAGLERLENMFSLLDAIDNCDTTGCIFEQPCDPCQLKLCDVMKEMGAIRREGGGE